MPSTSITFRTDQATKDALDELAEAQKRPRSFLVNEAIESYLEQDRRIRAQIQEGLDDMEAGRTVPHKEVLEQMQGWIEKWS